MFSLVLRLHCIELMEYIVMVQERLTDIPKTAGMTVSCGAVGRPAESTGEEHITKILLYQRTVVGQI